MPLDSNKYFKSYINAPLSESDKKEILLNKETLINKGAFEEEPVFGTGGMRAVVGHGTSRLNIFNITRLNAALAKNLVKNFTNEIKIVIAYDSRNSSRTFAQITYHFLTSRGFKVNVFKRPSPTPLLSFAVRHLNAQCGIVITASHNPPEYNGYKVYWSDGGQIVSPLDKNIQKSFIETNYKDIPPEVYKWQNEKILNDDLIEENIFQNYMHKIKKEPFINTKEKKIKILYSPLHGTGGWIFEKAFKECGFINFDILNSQKEPDGNFPEVKSPNPEEELSFEKLFIQGKKNNYDLLLATDPDADRIGCAYKEKNNYIFLNGNQIGCILLEYMIQKKKNLLKNPYICKTIVTTNLQNKIAESANIQIKESLTGFKYIAEAIKEDPENYLFGSEESFGYLPINWVRDKDSLSSALALASIAEEKSLINLLYEIYQKYGLYFEILHNIKFSPEESSKMKAFLEKLENPASFISNLNISRKIIDILDLRANTKQPATEEAIKLKKSLPESFVIQYFLMPEGRLTIRPSGTEPKVKIYISLSEKTKESKSSIEEKKKKLEEEAKNILTEFLKCLNIQKE
ncbi:MAG: phospho-sugar mutase [Spirochaetia bacterium]|nr:phospho-sugar mutase [Spirochaetia bacterium]